MRRHDKWLVILLLLIGFAVRIIDLTANPSGFSSEEITSIRITRTIATEGTITVFFDTGDRGVESLYHLLQVISTFFIGDGLLGYRMLSIWGSLVSLALMFAVAKRLFGRSVAYVALMAMLFGIWPVINARTASPVALMNAAVLLVLWTTAHAYHIQQNTLKTRRPATLPYTTMALAIVFVVYLHYTGILAGIGLIAFVLYLYYSRQPVSRHAWWTSGYALNLALILGLPYLISVLRNPQAAGLYTLWAERPESILDFLESSGRTGLAFFVRGDRDPTHNVPGLPALSSIEGGLLMTVGLVIAGLRWRNPNYALVLILFGLSILPDIWLQGGPDYTALAFAGPLVYLLVGIGVVELLQILRTNTDPPARLAWLKRPTILGTWPQPLVRASMVLLAIIFVRYVLVSQQRVFEDWPARSDTQQAYQVNLGYIARYLDTRDDDVPVLICADEIERANIPNFDEPLADQQLLEWMQHRGESNYRIADCNQSLILTDGGAPMEILFVDVADIATMPPPLRTWLNEAESITVEPLPEGSLYRVDVQEQLAAKGGMLARESVVLYPQETTNTGEIVRPEAYPIRFGGNMTFLGHDPFVPPHPLQTGDIVPLTTYWRIDGEVSANTGVFIRLHDTPQASPYTEVNRFDVDPVLLQPRDIIVQVTFLPLPTTLRAQDYQLTIGVYDGNPTNQFPVFEGNTSIVRGAYLLFGRPFPVMTP